jgi:hypothetical protein
VKDARVELLEFEESEELLLDELDSDDEEEVKL